MWNIEFIPDDAALYYRVHKGFVVEGELIPGAFKERGEGENRGMSTDWNKYATAEDALNRSKNPSDNGIVSFNVDEVRSIKDIILEHAQNQIIKHTVTSKAFHPKSL